MEAIIAESVVKTFGDTRALDGVTLRIEPGELFFLLGPSGCGKTTLLRCIAGLAQPTSGAVFFGDREVTQLPPHQREAAMVFQSYALWPHLTVGQNVAFGLEERKVPKAEIRRRVAEALEMVRLGGFGGRTIDQMSGGQQQRVSLARALVVKPKCLLLDEPLSNLDAQLRVEMRREIRRIVKENGLTGIYVTHDQEEALAMADRLAVLREGKLSQVGTPEEIYRTPRSAHVAGFIGETNIFRGELVAVGGGTAQVKTAAGEMAGRLGDQAWKPAAGDEVELSVRPEGWQFAGGGDGISGTVAERNYLGQRVQYWVETAVGRQQVVELNPHGLRETGAAVALRARPDDVVVLNPQAEIP